MNVDGLIEDFVFWLAVLMMVGMGTALGILMWVIIKQI